MVAVSADARRTFPIAGIAGAEARLACVINDAYAASAVEDEKEEVEWRSDMIARAGAEARATFAIMSVAGAETRAPVVIVDVSGT